MMNWWCLHVTLLYSMASASARFTPSPISILFLVALCLPYNSTQSSSSLARTPYAFYIYFYTLVPSLTPESENVSVEHGNFLIRITSYQHSHRIDRTREKKINIWANEPKSNAHTHPMSTHLYSNNEHVQFYHKCAHISMCVQQNWLGKRSMLCVQRTRKHDEREYESYDVRVSCPHMCASSITICV